MLYEELIERLKEIVPSVDNFSKLETILKIDRKKIKKICALKNINYSHFTNDPNVNKHVGKKYFKIEIISINESIRGRRKANCVCDCGKECVLRLDSILSGKTKSCGCISKRRTCMDGSKNHAFKGIKEIPSTWLYSFKRGAEKRNIEWNITIEDVYKIFEKQNKKCALTGRELFFGRIRKRLETNASLDRIDSSKGYFPDNIQIIIKQVNLMKSTFSQEEFLNICFDISNFKQKD